MPVLSRLLLACTAFVSVGGCGGTVATPVAVDRVQSLWSARSPDVGDNSRVVALVNEVGVARAGSYSIALRTMKAPYRLVITLKAPDKPFADTEFGVPETLLLGLIGNLDEVVISSGSMSDTLTARAASTNLGYDVKRLGQDKGALATYLDDSND